MDTTEEKTPTEKSKANVLRDALSKNKCQSSDDAKPQMPPMIASLLAKLGLGLPGAESPNSAHGTVIVVAKKMDKAPDANEPSGAKKVLEKEKTESLTPFARRCLSAITGKEECCGMGSDGEKASDRIKQALEAIKKRKKSKEHEF